MKNFTLQKLGLVALLVLACTLALSAQEKSSGKIAVIKKVTREDGTTTVEKGQITEGEGIFQHLKGLEKVNGKDVKIHLLEAGNEAVEVDEKNGETLIFVRSAASEKTGVKGDVEKVHVMWHDQNGATPKVIGVAPKVADVTRIVNVSRNPCKVFIGVGTSTRNGEGLHVDYTVDDTPAEKYGVQEGDIILSLDNVAVKSQSQLEFERDKHKPGEAFTLTIMRDGKEMQVNARFKECSEEELKAYEEVKANKFNYNYDFNYNFENVANHRNPCDVFIGIGSSEAPERGRRVDYTIENTPAQKYGIKAGDIILALNGKEVKTHSEVITERDKHKPGEEFTLTILRDGQEMQINARFNECSEEEMEQARIAKEERMAATEKRMEEVQARIEETRVRMQEMRDVRREGLVKVAREQRPILGIYVDETTNEGITVSSVTSGKGAQAAGLRSGDVITIVDGKVVGETSSIAGALATHKVGDNVQVVYIRDGVQINTNIVLSASNEFVSYSVQRDPCDVFIGVYTSDRGIDNKGVRVTGVIDDTPAKKSQVQPGDVILALDDMPTNSHQELRFERDKHKPGEDFTLSIIRDGSYMEIDATFKSCPTTTEEPTTPVEEVVEIAVEDAPVAKEEEALPQLQLNSELKVEAFNLYPNPTVGLFNVQFQAAAVPTTVRIMDASGKEVYTESLNNFDGNYNKQLNLSGKTPGTYILTVQQGKELISKKIVLMPRV
ncbi:MAG: PDZ domain-containing protein [Saprospiraceae bacterium]|nr:PDZ domain-containing protein [Saprospiraceae bacterium]